MNNSDDGIRASVIAEIVGGELVGQDRHVFGPCAIDRPRPNTLAFCKTVDRLAAVRDRLRETVVLATRDAVGAVDATLIVVEAPRQAFAIALGRCFGRPKPTGIAETARISPDAKLGEDVVIGDFCVIGPGVVVGARTELRSRVTLAAGVRIGTDCLIKSGAVLGEEGFGFEKDEGGLNLRLAHSGSVVVEDNVEIGANTVICGGTLEPTVIEAHTKIDDLVFVAHNCRIGRNSLIIACAEISGSVDVGAGVWIGPNATIINGLTIRDRAYIGGGAAVIKNCEADTVYAGVPARPLRPRRTSD